LRSEHPQPLYWPLKKKNFELSDFLVIDAKSPICHVCWTDAIHKGDMNILELLKNNTAAPSSDYLVQYASMQQSIKDLLWLFENNMVRKKITAYSSTCKSLVPQIFSENGDYLAIGAYNGYPVAIKELYPILMSELKFN